MSDKSARWGDLWVRLAASAGLIIIAVAAVWINGDVLAAVILCLFALMLWELWQMLRRGVTSTTRAAFMTFLLAVPIGFALLVLFVYFSAPEELALGPWPGWILGAWLVGVVIATDIAGYFGGKLIGGPKVWARVSPGKTWAGVISGWIVAIAAAYLVAQAASLPELYKWALAGLFVSVFAQIGDFSESALKRALGAKDSSNFIPGHGGFCDRFDGLIGGIYGMMLAYWVLSLPMLFK